MVSRVGIVERVRFEVARNVLEHDFTILWMDAFFHLLPLIAGSQPALHRSYLLFDLIADHLHGLSQIVRLKKFTESAKTFKQAILP